MAATMTATAVVSDDGVYRYRLTRSWADAGDLITEPRGPATFVMLNPSTADAVVDDPTIRRCVSFARTWGCSGLTVVNLYALRATDPKRLWEHPDPRGPLNVDYLDLALLDAEAVGLPVVAAWGVHGSNDLMKPPAVDVVTDLARRRGARLTCLGVTKEGHPRHPLYVPASAAPSLADLTPWEPR